MTKRRPRNQTWFPTIKVRNHLPFLACRWCDTYHWKDIDESYNFASHFISIKGLYGLPKLQKSQFSEFQDSNLGVAGQNDIWMLAPWPRIENTIKGKVVASPKSRPWWVLRVYVCLWVIHAPKVLQLCINRLVV
jgi:hypothetical protein